MKSILTLLLLLPLCSVLPSASSTPKFALGTIQSAFFNEDELLASSCFNAFRTQALETIRSNNPISALDSAVYLLYWGRFDQALEILDRCLKYTSDPFEQGYMYLGKTIALASKAEREHFFKRTYESRLLAKQALNICDSIQSWCEHDQLYWKLNACMNGLVLNRDAEIKGYWEMSRLRPEDHELLSFITKRAFELQQVEFTDSAFQKMLDLSLLSTSDWAVRAAEQFRLKQYDKCIEACDVVLSADKTQFDISMIKAKSLYELERYEEATPYFSDLVRANASDKRTWYRLGYCYRMTDHLDEAIQAFSTALHIDSRYYRCYRQIARCEESRGDLNAAVIYADSAFRIARDDPENGWLLGWLLQQSKRFGESIIYYNQALEIDHSNEDIWLELAQSYSLLGLREKMYAAIDSALSYNPNHAKALRVAAWNNRDDKNYAAALKFYDQLVSIEPKDADAWAEKSVAEYLAGRYEDSLTSCETALKLAPHRKDLLSQRHDILLKLGKTG